MSLSWPTFFNFRRKKCGEQGDYCACCAVGEHTWQEFPVLWVVNRWRVMHIGKIFIFMNSLQVFGILFAWRLVQPANQRVYLTSHDQIVRLNVPLKVWVHKPVMKGSTSNHGWKRSPLTHILCLATRREWAFSFSFIQMQNRCLNS